MIKAFISYAHEDEFYRKELEKHLSVLRRNGYIDTWTDREIAPGQEWSRSISEELLTAKIILLLISADFLASDYCYDIELKTAMERHERQDAVVIPVILRFCDWSNTPFSRLQGLPYGGKPVKDWEDIDEAFLDVVKGIKVAINSLANPQGSNSGLPAAEAAAAQLSTLRIRVLTAKNAGELKRILFDIAQFRAAHPANFEIEELETMVKDGLAYETRPLGPQPGRPAPYTLSPPKASPVSGLWVWLGLGLLIVMLLGVYLFKRFA